MSLLLDTHTLLWALLQPSKLSTVHRDLLGSKTEQKFFSTISLWEISLKFAVGKLDLGGHQPEEIFAEALRVDLQLLPPAPESFVSFYHLPMMTGHKDPFDRMLIWQAIEQDLMLVSCDSQLPHYRVHGLKLA